MIRRTVLGPVGVFGLVSLVGLVGCLLFPRAALAAEDAKTVTAAPAPQTAASAPQTAASAPETPAPAAAPEAPKAEGPKPGQRAVTFESLGAHEITWDANIEGGFGRALGDLHHRTVSFARVRGGILWVHGNWFTSGGLFYDLSNFTPGTFGVQIEQMHLSSGLWIQVGGGVDVEPRAMGMLSVGWSVIGVEAQYRSFGDAGIGPAFFGKLRIPLGVIGHALRNRR